MIIINIKLIFKLFIYLNKNINIINILNIKYFYYIFKYIKKCYIISKNFLLFQIFIIKFKINLFLNI